MWSVSDLISAKIVQLASPQPLNHPQSSRHAPRPEGARPGKGGVFHSRSSGSASPPPAPSEAAHVQRPCSRTAQYHSHLRAQSAYHLSPAIAAGYSSAGLSGGIWEHFPGQHRRRDTILFPEPRLHAPNPGQTPGLSPRPGEPAAWLHGAAPDWRCAGCKRAQRRLLSRLLSPHSPPRVSPSQSPLGT